MPEPKNAMAWVEEQERKDPGLRVRAEAEMAAMDRETWVHELSESIGRRCHALFRLRQIRPEWDIADGHSATPGLICRSCVVTVMGVAIKGPLSWTDGPDA